MGRRMAGCGGLDHKVLMRLKCLECAYVGDANCFRRESAELPAAEKTKNVWGSMGEG